MKNIEMTCPKCGTHYTLGVNGVYAGCDRCMDIHRNSQGMIIYGLPSEQTIINRMFKGPGYQEGKKHS